MNMGTVPEKKCLCVDVHEKAARITSHRPCC
jgi:hypothetical protein